MIELISTYSIMLLQFVLLIFGALALVRILRNKSKHLDLVTVSISLVSLTQLMLNFIREKYGASVLSYPNAFDWITGNFVAALCLLFLLIVLFRVERSL